MNIKKEELLREAVFKQPLVLLTLKDEESIKYVESFLPYSIGFEIECHQGEQFSQDHFKKIPNIMDVQCDPSEQRFRIPPGIRGLVCLWHITECLKIYSDLNLGSGIHYHVDMTANWNRLNPKIVEENEPWLMEECDKWEYKGTYNSRGLSFTTYNDDSYYSGAWIRFQSDFKTAEFRIGEMSFDYDYIVSRMIDASRIITKLIEEIKGDLNVEIPPVTNHKELINFKTVDIRRGKTINIKNLHEQLKEIKKEEQEEEEEDIDAIMRNRIIK